MRALKVEELSHVSGGLYPPVSTNPTAPGVGRLSAAQEQQCAAMAGGIMNDLQNMGFTTAGGMATLGSAGKPNGATNAGAAAAYGVSFAQGTALVDKLDAYAQVDTCGTAHNSFNSFMASIGNFFGAIANFFHMEQPHQSGG